MLERAGLISELRFQVRYVLIPGFVRDGKKIRPIEYVADAVYVENGVTITEDTKSSATQKIAVYRMKKKMLLYFFPEINFRENLSK